MAKLKHKNNKSSESVQKVNKKKQINPFEVHINREKFKVLGKRTKNDRGLPGISRQKALNKRKHTLQQEFKLQHKSNKFLDKRIGEKDVNMTNEDRFIARYAKLKAKNHKKSIFNLADEEILTHKGQTLSEIEKFDDTRSDDEDSADELNSGKLYNDFVEEAHFGGGILKKTGVDGEKSHKTLIDQLIAESKKRKAEKQKLKEETLELTEKLDSEWKDLLPLVNKTNSANAETVQEKADEYDKVMRQLKFEARGTPSDRLKTEDEVAKEEKEKLEELEQERLTRMRGFTDNNVTKKHHSADDLDDNFAYDSDTEFTLSYNKEGVANVKLEAEINGKTINAQETEHEDENSDNNSESNSDNSIDESEDDEDNLSDLKEDQIESESDEEDNVHNSEMNTSEKETDTNEKNITDIRTDLMKRKAIMDKARQELPYTYTFPESYEALQSLLQNESAERQHIIIERIIKCNHPSLAKANKENLSILFAYLLQYINDFSSDILCSEDINKCFHIYSNLVPHLFDLAQMNSENAHGSVTEVIKEKQLDYRKNKYCYPGIDVLLFLKLVSCLFPTSDFRHMVVTPAIVFIDQMLNNCKVRSTRDIAFGLFLTTLVLEYTNLSKRYLPSAVNYLSGILHMCIPKTGVRLIKISPPFKPSSNTLVLFNNWSESDVKLSMDFAYIVNGELEDEFKIRVLYQALCLSEEFMINFKELQSGYEIFTPIEKHLDMIPMNNYPDEVRTKAITLKEKISSLKANRSLQYLVMTKRRPKALRLYEPSIEKVFDTKRHKIQSKEKMERDKLLHKIKREKKGALREIRRDKAFLGRLKINQQIQSDRERREKVNKLLSEASIQQSELNAMDRKKKRK